MQTNNFQPVKTRKQIADEYSISDRTLRRWLTNAGIELPNRMLSLVEQELIYQQFGDPNQPTEEEDP